MKDCLNGYSNIDESPYRDISTCKRKATCIICGNTITKGEKVIRFAASKTDGSYNSWTAVEKQAHFDCVDIKYQSKY